MEWKSPRKVEEEITLYRRKRFEEYMEYAEIGLMTREEAIAAFTAEINDPPHEDDCPTQPFLPFAGDGSDRFDVYPTDD